MALLSYFVDATSADAEVAMKPLLDEAQAEGYFLVSANVTEGLANDVVFQPDSAAGSNSIIGSRLIPEKVYREEVEEIGKTYAALLDDGSPEYVVLVDVLCSLLLIIVRF